MSGANAGFTDEYKFAFFVFGEFQKSGHKVLIDAALIVIKGDEVAAFYDASH